VDVFSCDVASAGRAGSEEVRVFFSELVGLLRMLWASHLDCPVGVVLEVTVAVELVTALGEVVEMWWIVVLALW